MINNGKFNTLNKTKEIKNENKQTTKQKELKTLEFHNMKTEIATMQNKRPFSAKANHI